MKTKTKLLTFLFPIVSGIVFVNLPISSNVQSSNNNDSQLNSNNKNSELIEKTFDATLIGAQKGTFTVRYKDVDHCKIVNVNSEFSAYGYFDFNGGCFAYDGITYTITEIGNEVFYSNVLHLKYFHDVYLTIPSTIKRIGQNAFNCCYKVFGNEAIHSINFQEGIEYIGANAFSLCCDISEKYIKLPNSLKSISFDSFSKTNVEILDLSDLDHVIEVINKNNEEEEEVSTSKLKKIYVKNEKMKQEYSKAKSWIFAPEPFEVKDDPTYTKLTIDAKLIGGDAGDIILDVTDSNDAIIKECSDDFSAYGNFNFNGGHFIFCGCTYTITRIDKKVFYHKKGSSYTDFHETNLIIPSTIKYIGDEAFYNNSYLGSRKKELIGLSFEEGIEEIGKSAFEKCNDIIQDTLKLPNSLKKLGNRAFVNTGDLKFFDLTALDHVIDVDCDPLSKNGCLPTEQIKKIYFKDKATMNLYLNNKYWESCAKYFEIKEVPPTPPTPPTPIKELTINASELGAKTGSIILDAVDPNNCIIKKVSNNFKAIGNFNFNNGKFIHNNKTYTITKIDNNVFKSSDENYSFFENCNLTIPSTIKEIGKEAFANYSNSANSKFNSVNFENGIKSISDSAFANALSLNSNHLLELPESIQHLGNNAFKNNCLKYIKIDSEEVINVNKDVLDENGCFVQNNIKTIYVETEKIKNNYINNMYWRCCTFIIKVYDKPLPDECITIDAKKLGAQNGTITLNVKNPNNAIIESCSDDFYATGDFNFNDGRFVYDGKKYKISEIAAEVFKLSSQDHYFFQNCNLTIPSSINEIGNNAFENYANSNNHKIFNSIYFEEGIKTIGESAFANTLNKDSNHSLILPNTINYLDDSAFANDYINEITLFWVEDVIKTNNDVLNKNGCFANNFINKIYVKSEKVKQRYVNSDNWKSCKDIIEVKDAPIPTEKNIINITLTNQTTWKIDAKYIDGLWDETTEEIILGDNFFEKDAIKVISFSNIDNLINIEKCFLKGCNNLEFVDLSGLINLQTIGDFFLANCPKVKNVVFPESLVSIGNDFLKANTNIEQITLNTPNLKEIGFGFLEGCTNVKIVDFSTIKNNFIEYRYNFAGDSTVLEHIYVDQSLLDKYLQNEEWSSHFKDGVITIKN